MPWMKVDIWMRPNASTNTEAQAYKAIPLLTVPFHIPP
jgi:hypothetical protein